MFIPQIFSRFYPCDQLENYLSQPSIKTPKIHPGRCSERISNPVKNARCAMSYLWSYADPLGSRQSILHRVGKLFTSLHNPFFLSFAILGAFCRWGNDNQTFRNRLSSSHECPVGELANAGRACFKKGANTASSGPCIRVSTNCVGICFVSSRKFRGYDNTE